MKENKRQTQGVLGQLWRCIWNSQGPIAASLFDFSGSSTRMLTREYDSPSILAFRFGQEPLGVWISEVYGGSRVGEYMGSPAERKQIIVLGDLGLEPRPQYSLDIRSTTPPTCLIRYWDNKQSIY